VGYVSRRAPGVPVFISCFSGVVAFPEVNGSNGEALEAYLIRGLDRE